MVKAKLSRKASTKRRKLEFLSESDSGQSDDGSDVISKDVQRSAKVAEGIETPLQRYMDKVKRDLDEKKQELCKLEMDERDTEREILRVKSNAENGNMCKNCHLRLGHTARNCDFDKRQSVCKCGEEKLHAGEIDRRGTRCAVSKLKGEIAKMEQDLINKEQSLNKLNESLPNRIERGLMEENENGYFERGVKKWCLLRKHVYLVEKYCKANFGGKIPAKHKVSNILSIALQGETVDGNERQSLQVKQARLCGSTSTRKNPVKNLLEDRGVTFPLDKASTSRTVCDDELQNSTVYRCAPTDENEEQEQIRMALQQSMYDRKPSEKTSKHGLPTTYPNPMAMTTTYPNPMAATYPYAMAATYPKQTAMPIIPRFPIIYPSHYGEIPNPMLNSEAMAVNSTATHEFFPRLPQPELQIAATAELQIAPQSEIEISSSSGSTIADDLSKFPINAGLAKAENPIFVSSHASSEENYAAQQLVSLSSIENLQG